ncbi:nucleotidyl transferase AbiEii/AbiGii toxin family protein [Jatrophihabitans sp.]|uniref:nucleotidyl transferase AbiEii/AbiGii toxin family protein n=1 Tax=Jatrophihabitans sp. TaxID=1932789 RepID=UPI002EE6F4FB
MPDDGVEFDLGTVTCRVIRGEDLYSGLRIAMNCAIASATVKLRLDVNFGDPIVPAPQTIGLPALRPGGPAISILGYPIETVLAEKIATAITLGAANTRVRDYADVYTLTGNRDLTHGAVRKALLATMNHRRADLVALSTVTGGIVNLRSRTYAAYRTGLGPDRMSLPEDFSTVVNAAVAFADRLAEGASPTTSWDSARRSWID